MSSPRNRLALLLLPAALTACGSDSQNPVKAAFAQRPASRAAAPVAFRFPDRTGNAVRIYRLPRFNEVAFRFNTPGLAVASIVGYSEDDDQIYVLSQRGTLISLDLGTGRSRMVDSGVAAAITGPTGTPFILGTDNNVAMVERRVPVAWPNARLPEAPVSLIGAGRGTLMVETRSGGKRQMVTLAFNRPTVTQPLPDGPIVASHWGDFVIVATDSGLVTIDPQKVRQTALMSLSSRPEAVALSASSHRVYAAQGSELVILDRFRGSEVARRDLPGRITEIRPDPWGRYLLLRPAAGDSIWIVDNTTSRYVATIGGTWSTDLPAVAADGSILCRQGNDVVTIAGDSLTTIGRTRGSAADRWVPIVWDPRRPALQLAEEAQPSPDVAAEVLYVQVSASQNATWAEDLAQNLKRSGMPAAVLAPATPEDLYRVVLGPYPNRDAAEDAGRKLGKSFWVFSRGEAPTTP